VFLGVLNDLFGIGNIFESVVRLAGGRCKKDASTLLHEHKGMHSLHLLKEMKCQKKTARLKKMSLEGR